MNSKCGVQSKRRCESQESCVCIVGFLACGCQKKSVVYETATSLSEVLSERYGRLDAWRLKVKHGNAHSTQITFFFFSFLKI